MRRNEVRTKTRVKISSKTRVSVRVKNRNAMAVEKQPFWVNPCGPTTSNGLAADQKPVLKGDLIDSIIEVTSNAQTTLDDIKIRYFKVVFPKESYDESKFGEIKFDWLPNIPKTFGKEVPQDYLETIDFKTALQDTYTNMQIIAAAIECVLKNQKFRRLKADIIGHIKLILCELYESMINSNVECPEDVKRDAIPKDFQEVSETTGIVRDWIIFRELRNNIEYIIQVFTYLQNH